MPRINRHANTPATSFAATHTHLLHTARTRHPDYDTAMDGYADVLEALRRDDFRRLRGCAADGRSKFTTWLMVVTRRLLLDSPRRPPSRARTVAQRILSRT